MNRRTQSGARPMFAGEATDRNAMWNFSLLLQSLPGRYLVLENDLTIAAASNAYLETTSTTREAILGRNILDVLGATSPMAAEARASFERVLREKIADVMPVRSHPPSRSEPDAELVERWSAVNSPVLDDDGDVIYVLHRLEELEDAPRPATRLSEHPSLRRAIDRTLQGLTARAEERYRQFFDSAPDAMIVVTDGRIEFLNTRTERMFGYTRDELAGRPVEILVPERFRRAHGDHLRRYFAHPELRAMGSGLELTGRRKDGSEFPVEIGLSPIRTERGVSVSASIRDGSERKRADEASSSSLMTRLIAAVEGIEGAFALFDENDRLVLCNGGYKSLLRGRSGSLVGLSYDELFDAFAWEIDFPEDAARVRFIEERKSMRRRDPVCTFDVRTCDGRSLRVCERPVADGGSVHTIWDLTEDRRRADELREARAAADAANAAKTEFVSSMSHELRTPLNAILGFAQLLHRDKKEPLSERHRARVDQILVGGDHLMHLVDDLLDLARIEAGGTSMAVKPVDLAEVLDEVTKTLEPMAAEQEVALGVELLIFEPKVIAADRTRFAQILMNLGSNAIKYNREGGRVTFVVSDPTPGYLRVSVHDTGLGIPANKRDRVFQPFHRAGQEAGLIEGTGIGLFISRRLARLMGGDLDFRSTEGEGSEFWVDIPLFDRV